MNVIKLISSFVIASLDVLLISYYFKAKYPAKSKNVYFVMAICIPILAITNYTFVVLEIPYLFINAFVIYMLSCAFELSKKETFTSVSFLFIIKIIIEISRIYLFEYLFDTTLLTNIQFNEYFLKILSILFAKYIQYCIYLRNISSTTTNIIYNLKNFKLYSICISLLFSYTILCITFVNEITVTQINRILISTLIIYNIAFIMFEFLQKKHNKMKEEVETLKKKIESDIQYNLTQENDYDQIRHIKHDIKAKYFNLLIMLKEHEYEKAINYIQE